MWILVIFVIAFIIYLYMQSSRVYERKLEVSKKISRVRSVLSRSRTFT